MTQGLMTQDTYKIPCEISLAL